MAILRLVGKLAEVIASLVAANGDEAKETEALMRGQEEIKAELDRRAFGR